MCRSASIRPARKICKPGWTEFVKQKHNAAIDAYKVWRDQGKPRFGPWFNQYYRCKLAYKNAVRNIKRNEDRIKADKAAKHLANKDPVSFWHDIKRFNKNTATLPTQIGGACGDAEISEKWNSHFSKIYNSVVNSEDDKYFDVNIEETTAVGITDFLFTVPQVIIAIANIKSKKSCGFDNVYTELIKYCSLSMIKVLCSLFNSFLLHGFLPKMLMSVLIKPILKKGESISDMDSYRPIALASCLSKVFESLLLDKTRVYLNTKSNQFAYKKKSNTDTCLFAFKEIIDSYNQHDGNVYCCFLDASKAYDRVSHKRLFNCLHHRKVPLIYIRILAFWYKNQIMYVKWGSAISAGFTVTNGVRQGSVLSPYLFCVYVDNMSNKLNNKKIGCMVGNMLINHLFYADDLCIFSPSSNGLQILLNTCFDYGLGWDIRFNEKKCEIMVFKSNKFRNVPVPRFFIGGKSSTNARRISI